MTDLRRRWKSDPHSADGETGETKGDTCLAQDHITSEKREPGLKAAVSSELRPWLHPGLPKAVGWAECVSLCLHVA